MPTSGTLSDNMMEEHRSYWIHGSTIPSPSNTTHWEALGTVLRSGCSGSVIEVARLQDKGITFELKELAEWYGMKLSGISVDECLTNR